MVNGAERRFQSTPSPRRETVGWRKRRFAAMYFNPLPPQGGRLWQGTSNNCLSRYFNPLPPQGGRPEASDVRTVVEKFQSTPSPRRETQDEMAQLKNKKISIHSLPKEGDIIMLLPRLSCLNFNPLPPQGGRPMPFF